MTFAAFLAEQVVVHLIDWSVAGVTGYLIGRGGKGRGVGIVLAILYAAAVAGTFRGGPPPGYGGPVLAAIAFGLMFWVGWRHKRRTIVQS